ncbi:MAG TPA: hypothetical protein VEW45_02220 [Candidatus Dormibacteraeota bacterium]|nr:hypothetical protein [Candidatus Dormibacteraeota bacterium]
MRDILRRIAVRTVIFAVGTALLTPLTARSAPPEVSAAIRLLDAADRPVALARADLAGRDRSAALTLFELERTIAAEDLDPAAALPTPGSAPMEATLYLKPALAPAPTPAPVVVPPPVAGETVTGLATWYCCTAGYRGLAVVALPGALGGRYDPPPASRYVTVCADRCVQLPVVDYCDCYWGTSSQKVADLSPEAWAAVSDRPQSAGVISVTVNLGG